MLKQSGRWTPMPSCVAPTPCCRMKFAFYPLKKSNRNFTPGVQHDQKHTSTTSGDTQSSARFIVDTCMPAAIRSMKKPWIGERTAFSAHTTSHPFALQLRRSKTVRAPSSKLPGTGRKRPGYFEFEVTAFCNTWCEPLPERCSISASGDCGPSSSLRFSMPAIGALQDRLYPLTDYI
jgi:hypothetical protein